jgi:putative addiction module component (TIGR02574 family)
LNADDLCDRLLTVNARLAPIFQLSRAEKLQLVEELWDSIALEESQQPLQPLAQWKIDELIRRKEAFEKDPSKARTWEQVKASILGQNA